MWYILLCVVRNAEHANGPVVNWTQAVRKRLGVTQSGMAELLRVSPKAVQSYEQGWRRLPQPLFAQLLVLLALHRDRSQTRPPCWDLTGCSKQDRSACPSSTLGSGRFCWFVSGKTCRRSTQRQDPGVMRCENCVVVARLLEGG